MLVRVSLVGLHDSVKKRAVDSCSSDTELIKTILLGEPHSQIDSINQKCSGSLVASEKFNKC